MGDETPDPTIARTPAARPAATTAPPLPKAPAPLPTPESTPTAEPEAKKKTRSGSQTRQRQSGIMVRLTAEEREAIQTRAQAAGLTVGAYIRAVALGSEGVRARRAPPVNRELLAEALAALNRVGNNINQIAHHLNAGGISDRERIGDASAAIKTTTRAILAALGKAAP